MILDEIKAGYVKDLIAKGQRLDGRTPMQLRPIEVKINPYENQEGAAWVKMGDTQVFCAVKVDLATPFADRPDEGVLAVGCEFSPIAHPQFFSGPPDEKSIELARVVDRGIRAANCIDLKKLYLEEGKVLGVFIDIHVLDHSGNLIDAAALGSMIALQNARLPKYENGKLIREERTGKLPLKNKVVTTTFEKINGQLVLDATIDEENASEGRLTFGASEDGYICAAQKSGQAPFTAAEIDQLIDACLEKKNELLKYV